MKIRKRWKINPKTKIKESEKIYSRSKRKREMRRGVKGERKYED